jgi:hypothetical protein
MIAVASWLSDNMKSCGMPNMFIMSCMELQRALAIVVMSSSGPQHSSVSFNVNHIAASRLWIVVIISALVNGILFTLTFGFLSLFAVFIVSLVYIITSLN